ncbi:MraY family glycosyltransferase [Sulfurimonas sp. HSL1-2]|uniref:glycosyltransferase family 4 protein n=1 Tax=Thiomicrolovo zhangzhouensis TaxID=3131933 RepID=UPI0031F77BDA
MFAEIIAIFIVSTIFTYALVCFSETLGLVDHPNGRSSHVHPTPHSGGIGIFTALMIGQIFFEPELFSQYPLLFVAIAFVFLVGIADDRFEASPKMKFVVIFVATLITFMEGFRITDIGHYFGTTLGLGWLALPFTLFAVAGFTNALNLIDGIDMLAGTVASIILLTLAYIGYIHNDELMMHLSLGTVAAIAGFLVFNFHPARIFMGDSGALTLGFIISMLSVHALNYVDATTIFFIAMVPILDTVVVMVRRIRWGRSPFAPDKTHIHHIIMRLKNNNVPLTVAIIASIQLVFSMIGVNLADNEPFLNLLIFGLIFFVFYIFLTLRIPRETESH